MSENENNVESSSDIEEEGEEIAFANGSETEDTHKRATTTLKTTVRKQKVVALKRPPPLKIAVNIIRILMYTGH